MYVKQLSVFLENRTGRLLTVAKVLKEHHINIVSISLADTSEYGLLRMIVSDPDRAKECLGESGFSAMITEVLAVRLPNGVGQLEALLELLSEKEQNVEYMYILATGAGNDSMIVKTSDPASAAQVLAEGGMELFEPGDAYAIS